MFDSMETRGWISLILGFVTLAAGVIPILNSLGIIGFNLPISIAGMLMGILMIAGAIFLFIDATHETWLSHVTVFTGIVILIFGAIPILNYFGVINLDLSSRPVFDWIKNILLTAGGLFLIFGSGD